MAFSQTQLPLCMLLSVVGLCIVLCEAVDDTLTPGASGSDVVRAVVGRIEDSNIFPSDNQLLRRIAYVESKDGTDSNTYRSGYYGGVWQVDKKGFDDTQDTGAHPALSDKFGKIRKIFGIDWSQVQWKNLSKPLYSGLAARLRLSNVFSPIPMASDITAQGQYWKTYYNSADGAGTVNKFVEDVKALIQKETCNTNSDIFFVLDSSRSIGEQDFDQVRSFVYEFVSSLKIGPDDNQVGIISFSTTARVDVYLNSHSTKQDLLTAVENISYDDGSSTNTADGLCKLIREGYTTLRGARLSSASVSRLAIVMTDGRSGGISYECSFLGTDTLQAAEAVHSFESSILVYAIGVTSNINLQELNAIASKPEYVSAINSFDSSLLQGIQEQQTYELCNRVSVSAKIGNGLEGTLDRGENIRYQYSLPGDGMTIKVCVQVGNIVLYASTRVTTPNSALYEYKLDISGQSSGTEVCDDVFVKSSESNIVSELTNTALYVALNGVDQSNTFALNSTTGDTTSGASSVTRTPWSPLIMAVVTALVHKVFA